MFIKRILLAGRAQRYFFSVLNYNKIDSNSLLSLQDTIQNRLSQYSQEYESINEELTNRVQSLASQQIEQYRIRISELQAYQELHLAFSQKIQYAQQLDEDLKREKDQELIEFMKDERFETKTALQELTKEAINILLEKDQYDACTDISIEIRAGVGGSESSLFAEDVFHMYQNYLSQNGFNYKVQQHNKDTAISKGCKSAILEASGEEAYRKLKCESGVHKVIRVPETEKSGRLHSSTISVVVLPKTAFNFKIEEGDIKYEFMRAQGAGGQHVNKTESACRATHIASGLSVFIQEDRVQQRNKSKATEVTGAGDFFVHNNEFFVVKFMPKNLFKNFNNSQILKEKLFQMEVIKHQQKVNSSRKDQIGSGDRSDKIRTYNYQQDRITDHRTNITKYGMQNMMQGEYMEEFIEAQLQNIYSFRLSELIEDLQKTDEKKSPRPKSLKSVLEK